MSAQFESSRDPLFRELLESVPAIFYDVPVGVGCKGGYVSPQSLEILGISPEPAELFFEKLFALVCPEDREKAVREWEAAHRCGHPFSCEYRLSFKNAPDKFILNKGAFIRNNPDGHLHQTGMIIDISARKRIENTLRAREERYRKITESMSDYVFTIRLENGKVAETIHGGACQPITGYSPEEFTNNPNLWIDMVHEQDRKLIADRANRMLKGEDVEQITHRILNKSGRIRWVHSTIVTHRDGAGKILFFDGVIRDVTDQKRREEESKQRSYINEMLLDAVPFAAVLLQADGEVLAANHAGVEMGFEPGQSWNAAWTEVGPAYDCANLLAQAMEGGEKKVAEVKQGGVYYEATLVPHEPDLCLCTFYDITARKHTEHALRADKLIIEAMMDNPMTSIMLLDKDCRFEAVNPTAMRLLDISAAEIAGLTMHEVFPHKQAAARLEKINEALAGHAPARLSDHINGHDLDTMIIPVFDDDGVLVRIALFARDVTETNRSATQLLEAYQTLACIVERSPNAIISVDRESRVRLWNPAAERMFGWKAAEVYDQPLAVFGLPYPESIAQMRDAVYRGEGITRAQVQTFGKEGGAQKMLLSGGPLVNAEGSIDGVILILEV